MNQGKEGSQNINMEWNHTVARLLHTVRDTDLDRDPQKWCNNKGTRPCMLLKTFLSFYYKLCQK